MIKKETVTKAGLLKVLDLMKTSGTRYWLDGGWGMDVLLGKQTREHRDVDISFDTRYTDALLHTLVSHGYEITTDQCPMRVGLYHPELSCVGIHPLMIGEDGATEQADSESRQYEFETDCFGSTVLEGRAIPYISAKRQRTFYIGYEFREVDKCDIRIIDCLLSVQSNDKDETGGTVCRAKKQLGS